MRVCFVNVMFFCSAVSHSVMSEMQVIEQETPVGVKSSSRSKLDMFDEPGFASGPPKYVCDGRHLCVCVCVCL